MPFRPLCGLGRSEEMAHLLLRYRVLVILFVNSMTTLLAQDAVRGGPIRQSIILNFPTVLVGRNVKGIVI
jgi:hypothetical protein